MKNQKQFYNGFAPINKLIAQTAKEYNLEAAMNKHKVVKHWYEVASSFIEEVKEFTQAVDFKKGVLTVACLSREVASKIKLQAQRIIYALNQLLGRQLVFAIYIEQ